MREVLVGIDDSSASERALDRALREAETSGRPLRALHCWWPSVWLAGSPGASYGRIDPAFPELLRISASNAQQLADDLLAKAGRRTSPAAAHAVAEAQQGDAGRLLVEAAEHAGLVVVGGRGHGAVASAVLGSATAYVLHHALCPVMIVPEQGPPAGGFARVLVGVDGSPSSRSALLWGLDAARREGCPLVAVYSWQSTTVPGRPPMAAAPTLQEYRSAATTWLEQALAESLPADHGVEVRRAAVHSTPAWGLIETATADDLLVLGSRGRGGFASLLLGSVAMQCSQHAPSTVVVVRADQERLP